MNKINTNINIQNLFYINNLKFEIRELLLVQFVLIICYKTRTNTMQRKVEKYILLSIYDREEGIREEN